MDSLDISVIVCTHNRCDSLRDTLLSLTKQEINCKRVEVVVVDSKSSDNTKKVVREISNDSQLSIRYIREDRLGLNIARNAGINEARGLILAFIDDDAIAETDWLIRLVEPLEKDGIDCVGGKAEPLWEAARPSWLGDKLYRFIAVTDFGIEARYLKVPEHPYGVNMAFRKKVFVEVGTFREDLSRIGNRLVSAGETDFYHRAAKRGETLYYMPDAVVHHKIPADRLTKSFFRRRVYWGGRSDARFHNYTYGFIYNIRVILKRLFWDIPLLLPKVIYWKLRGERAFYFEVECRLIETVGYMHEFIVRIGNYAMRHVSILKARNA